MDDFCRAEVLLESIYPIFSQIETLIFVEKSASIADVTYEPFVNLEYFYYQIDINGRLYDRFYL